MDDSVLEQVAATPVREVARRPAVIVEATESLGEVVRKMRDHQRGAAVVRDAGGALLGIFTERDLMLGLRHGDTDWRRAPVGEVMTRNPSSTHADESVSLVLQRMNEVACRHLPVLDASGRVEGILSIRDLLAHLVDRFPQEFLNLPPDPTREPRARWGG